MERYLSQKWGEKIALDGYSYCKDKEGKEDTVYGRCDEQAAGATRCLRPGDNVNVMKIHNVYICQ